MSAKIVTAALAACLLSTAAPAQPSILCRIAPDYECDWSAVARCARRPYPPFPPEPGTFSQSAHFEDRFREIMLCRELLAARHAGWRAATDKPDPVEAVPMMLPEDFEDVRP